MVVTGAPESGHLLKNRAYEILRERIVSGELAPGERLSERMLGAELEMSKTPVKAALERLEAQGFVTLSPQRRATVRAMTAQEIADHYELRIALEAFIARRLTGNLTPVDAERLRANLQAQRAITTRRSRELEGWGEADYGFHITLAQALGNHEITRILENHRDKLRRIVAGIARRDPSVPAISCLEHHTIFDHIVNGRRDEAIHAAIVHLENGRRFVLEGGIYGAGQD